MSSTPTAPVVAVKRIPILRRAGTLLILLLLAALVWYITAPYCWVTIVAELDPVGSGAEAAKSRLIQNRNRSIPAMIWYLKRGPAVARGGLHTIRRVLGMTGEAGKAALVAAIESEAVPEVKVRLIVSYQRIYNDYRYMPDWLSLVEQNRFSARLTYYWLRYTLPEHMPGYQWDDAISPDFVEWYQERSGPGGIFPPYTFMGASRTSQ